MISPESSIVYYNNGRSITENMEKDPPWAMMIADDLVRCAMTREEVDEDLDTRRVVFFKGMGWRSAEQRQNTCRAPQFFLQKPQ